MRGTFKRKFNYSQIETCLQLLISETSDDDERKLLLQAQSYVKEAKGTVNEVQIERED